MTLIAGHLSFNIPINQRRDFPTFTSTVITNRYQDTVGSLSVIQKKSHVLCHQALFVSPGLAVVLTDACLLNHDDLFNQLAIKPSATISDAELIFRAYQKWGEHCVSYLTGNFVFAIWDIKAQKLSLGRDISGERSLYYYQDEHRVLYFASLPRFLVELPQFKKRINTQKLTSFLILIPDDEKTTFFEGVNPVPAGHLLTLKRPHPFPQLKQYWCASDYLETPFMFNNPADYYEAFQHLFRNVMSDYLSSDHKTVSHLSGGLDSSAVTCMAAQLLQQKNEKMTALCHIPRTHKKSPYTHWTYNDKFYMQAVEELYPNLTNYYVNVSDRKLFEYNRDIDPWLDAPTMNPTNNIWMIACMEATKELGATKLLSGQRGNATISWSGGINAQSLSSLQKIKRFISQKQRMISEIQDKILKLKPWETFSGISNHLAREKNLYKQYHQKNNKKIQKATHDFRAYYCDYMIDSLSTSSLPNTLRFLYDVELLDPTADKRIIEFCLRVPANIYACGKESRLLVRKGLKEILPLCIQQRTTRGMQLADWYHYVDLQKDEFKRLLHTWDKTPLSNYINTRSLLSELAQWDINQVEPSSGKKYRYYSSSYKHKLLRAIETGLFLQQHFGGIESML
jgi:asparagine synthase (glutamine-hydrolysing)